MATTASSNQTLVWTTFHQPESEGMNLQDFIINNFKDIQAPFWLKVSGSVIYSIQVLGSLMLIIFIIFERKGSFGHFRSVINDINTWLYVIVAVYCVVTVGIDLSRLIMGPLPGLLCDWNIVLKNTAVVSATFLNVAIAFFKFMFLCVWKSYRQMNHKFITAFIGMSSVMIGFLMSLAFTFGPGKTTMYRTICTSTYQPSENYLGPRIPMVNLAINTGFITYIGFMIPITIQRWLNKKKDRKYQQKNPTDLTTMMSNLGIMMALAFSSIVLMDLSKYSKKDQIDLGDIWKHPMSMYFVDPLCVIACIVTRLMIKRGKHIVKLLKRLSLKTRTQ